MAPEPPLKTLPLPGEIFNLGEHTAFLIAAPRPAPGWPWVWYAPTLPNLPGQEERWMFTRWQAAGLAVAGIDAGESFGSPHGRQVFSALYTHLTRLGYARRACLLARSRGGLMHYNWAAEHPKAVACIAGIYPVCDLLSYPGIDAVAPAYGMSPQEILRVMDAHNPVMRTAPLARAGVPIFHIHGDADWVVPLALNSGALAERYAAHGGRMTLRVVAGGQHDMNPAWFECQELVDFVIAHSKRQ